MFLCAVLDQMRKIERFYKQENLTQEPRFNIVLDDKQRSYTAPQFYIIFT